MDGLILCRLPASPATASLAQACARRGLPVRLDRPAAARAAGPSTLLITRLPSGTPPESLWPLQALEAEGRVFVNRPSSLLVAHAKPLALQRLAAAGLPVPATVCVERDAPASLDALPGDRFVVKPAAGSSGRGVLIGLDRATAARAAQAFADASGPVLVQPLLGGGLDRRLLVVDGAVVAAMERVPAGHDGRGNLRYGAQPVAFTPQADQQALALAAARALALDIAAVDLLVDAGQSLILEVNACPGLAGLQRATGLDIASLLAESLQRRAAQLAAEGGAPHTR
ncbi:MAG: ATP-grasp domain-containing protein [Planctomycetota bacterium]